MPWLRHRLRDADVWAKVDAHAELIKDADGRVEIVYKPADGARVYRAGARNLTPAPDSAPVELNPGEPAEQRPARASSEAQPDAGASSARPDARSPSPSARPGSRSAAPRGAASGGA